MWVLIFFPQICADKNMAQICADKNTAQIWAEITDDVETPLRQLL
jgi:hypothetical protein